MTDEEIKLKRLRQAIEEDMTENELFEIARERRYRINDLEKENAELKELVDKQTSELMTRFFKIKRLEEKNKSLGGRVLQLEKDKGKLNDENEQLKKELDSYKAFDSKYDEIEEDTKVIVKENEELKKQLEDLQLAYTISVDKSVIREQELEAQIEK